MNSISLIPHNDGYKFSSQDLKRSILSGCSGIVYAARHLELAISEEETTKHFDWSHRTIALIETIPLLGALVTLCEYIAADHFLPTNQVIKDKEPTVVSAENGDNSLETNDDTEEVKSVAGAAEELNRYISKLEEITSSDSTQSNHIDAQQGLIKLVCKLFFNLVILYETRILKTRKNAIYLNFINSCLVSHNIRQIILEKIKQAETKEQKNEIYSEIIDILLEFNTSDNKNIETINLSLREILCEKQ